MRYLSLAVFLLTFLPRLPGNDGEIHGIAVEEKANGTLIRISVSSPVDPAQITAWTSETGWLYLTIVGAAIDTTRQWPFVGTGIVSQFEAHQFADAVQLNFRLVHPVKSFETDVLSSRGEVVISLRPPLTETLGALDRMKSRKGDEIEMDTPGKLSRVSRFEARLPYALIITGGGFVVSGLFSSSALQFLGGSAILTVGYVMLRRANRK